MSADTFGVYVHWPYCRAICPYCDFNVYRDRGGDHGDLFAAILADLEGWRARTGPQRADTLYLGGGTPSRLSPDQVATLIAAVQRLWGLAADAEVTLEINPEDADPHRMAAFAAAGVTRASVGVQALDDGALAALGRWHDAHTARRAVETCASTFAEVTFDLMYAREGQSLAAWSAELSEALHLGARHMSLYQLTIEPGTAFARRAARGDLVTPDEDTQAAFFDVTHDLLSQAGYQSYEVSNFAKPGAHSRHNLMYWRSGQWVGVGPGAHGRLGALGAGRLATEAAAARGAYTAAVDQDGWGVTQHEALTPMDQAQEVLAMGLRLAEGVDLARLSAATGLVPHAECLATLEDMGLVVCGGAGDRVAVTPKGRALSDRIAAEIASALEAVPVSTGG